jgi:hypothetical protein
MTVGEFIESNLDEASKPLGNRIAAIMVESGSMHLDSGTTKNQDTIRQAILENALIESANEITAMDEAEKDMKAEMKKADLLKHKEVKIKFSGRKEADSIQKYCNGKLRLRNTELVCVDGIWILKLFNVTDFDLRKVNNAMLLGKGTQALLAGAEKSQNTFNDAVDLTVNSVVMPAADIAARGGARILSTLGTAGVKTAASAVNATVEGIEKTKNDILGDDQIHQATANLISAKHKFAQRFGKKKGFGNNIEIVD